MMHVRGIEEIGGDHVPSNPESVVFGVLADKHDWSKGWLPLTIPEAGDADVKKGKGVQKGSVLNESLLGAGLQDGVTLAFAFREPGEDETDVDRVFDVIQPSYDDDGIQSQNKR